MNKEKSSEFAVRSCKILSRIGKQQLKIPAGVTLEVKDKEVEVRGPNGVQRAPILPYVELKVEGDICKSSLKSENKQAQANWGTTMALIRNAILGSKEMFEKVLEIEGIGFRVVKEGDSIVLNVGYSHPVRFTPPAGVAISVDKNSIVVRSNDKYLVGQVAADIRAIKKPEPYKGKGIRYKGEIIVRKAGKRVAGATS